MYEPVDSNVSYGSVTGLDFTGADQKLVYGKDNPSLQYGLLWLPANLAEGEKAPLVILIHGGCWLRWTSPDLARTRPGHWNTGAPATRVEAGRGASQMSGRVLRSRQGWKSIRLI